MIYGAVICVLRICSGVYIFVQKFLYCMDIFTPTTDEYVCVLRYRLR